MSEIGYAEIGARASSLYISPKTVTYDGVELYVGKNQEGEEVAYFAGNPNGTTLRVNCPWGTQEMAEAILSSVSGLEYQPYTATDALLPPEMQLGDGVEIGENYVGIYQKTTTFGPAMAAQIGAPEDNELEHEYPYTSPQERQLARMAETQAVLRVDVDSISAGVFGPDGALSQIDVRLNSITTEVQSAEGNIAEIQQTVNDQGTSIALVVDSSGAQASIKIDAIVDGINGAGSSVKINADHIVLDADKIQATGVLTWDNVSDKPDLLYDDDDTYDYITEITETTIRTTDITAVNLRGKYVYLQDRKEKIAGLITIEDADTSDFKITINSFGALDLRASDGSFYIYSNYGAIGSIRDGLGDWISVNATFSSNSNGGYDLGFLNKPWCDLYLVNEPTLRSDRRAKNSIDYDLSALEERYLRLRPCSYKRNGAEKTSFGFIAQDVDEVLGDGFSAVVRPQNEDELFALKLEQFIALNTHMIQKLWKKVESIEQGRNQ